MLQSEAGYIDARPQSRQIDETLCVGPPRRGASWYVRCTSDCDRMHCPAANDATGQCTKSLRDSPLRGGKSRESVASRVDSGGGWQGHRDQ
jgi:hypothetical protein